MAWGLEARVPFLDKAFLEVAMNIDAKHKMFTKGKDQEVDEDGHPKMEKVRSIPRRGFVFVHFLFPVHSPQSLRLLSQWQGIWVINGERIEVNRLF